MKNKIKLVALLILVAAISGWMLRKYLHLPSLALGTAKLSWEAVDDGDVKGYKVYYGTSPRAADCPQGGYESVEDAGKVTSYEIHNLKNKQTYYFSVTSYNESGGESCFSGEMQKKIDLSMKEIISGFVK